MQIVRYTADRKQEWDAFVTSSKNGTFLFLRDYMEYHADRFTDCSHLFYIEERLVALLPANIHGGTLYSHQGLTYGGLVLSGETTCRQVVLLVEELLPFIRQTYKVNRLVYRPVPAIYHLHPAEEDLYALFLQQAVLTERKVSSVVSPAFPLPFQKLRKRGVVKARRSLLTIQETTDYTDYWQLLSETLQVRFGALPVHSLNEIEWLSNRFPRQIKLFEVRHEERVVGGCLVFESTQVMHIQYIAANEMGKECGALDLLFDYLISDRYRDKPYIDFGRSMQEDGRMLNEGLIFQKEGFGARTVVYDTYELNLNEIK